MNAWSCPCGSEPAKNANAATPVKTLVALWVPKCPWCQRPFRDEYRLPADQGTED
jgi:hypothetical protein